MADFKETHAHVFLGEIYEVLQIDVVSVGPNVVVDEEVELVLDPVFEHEGQHSGGQLQKEDDPQEDGELQMKNINTAVNTQKSNLSECCQWRAYKFEQKGVFSQRSDATGEAKDEHHATHHQEEPDWVKATQVCDGGDVWEDALREKDVDLDSDLHWITFTESIAAERSHATKAQLQSNDKVPSFCVKSVLTGFS